MTQHNLGNQTPNQEVISRVESLTGKLKERAFAVDRAREIPVETVRDLHDAGLLAGSIPRSMGGTEIDLITLVTMFEILGAACASTTWCLVNHLASCAVAQRALGDRSAPYMQAVVEEGAAMGFGLVPTEATTQATQGGFKTSGRWPFISFSHR